MATIARRTHLIGWGGSLDGRDRKDVATGTEPFGAHDFPPDRRVEVVMIQGADRPSIPAPRIEISPRRGLRREEAARYVGVSPSKFDEMVGDGRMPKPKKIDACSVWDLRRLDLAWDALGGDDAGSNPWD